MCHYRCINAGVCLLLAAKFFMDMKKSVVKDLLEVCCNTCRHAYIHTYIHTIHAVHASEHYFFCQFVYIGDIRHVSCEL